MIYNSRKKLLAVCALISQNKEPAVLRCVKSLGAEERKICSSIKLPIRVLRVRVDGRRTLWLVQRIRAFVFLPHPVDDKHYHKDGTQQTNHCTSNNSWNNWKAVLLIVHTRNQKIQILPARMPGWAKNEVALSSGLFMVTSLLVPGSISGGYTSFSFAFSGS